MAFFRCGGNVGKNSLILPENVEVLNVFKDDKRVIIFWDIPKNSEIEIEKFNIYYCKAEALPETLEDFTYYTSVGKDIRRCEITPLENDVNYYFVVESVSVEDYENASLRGSSDKVCTRDTEIVLSCGNSNTYYYSKNGIDWSAQETYKEGSRIHYVNDRWISIAPTSGSVNISDNSYKITGTLYYSFDRVSWVTVNFSAVQSPYSSPNNVSRSETFVNNVEYINGMYAIASYRGGIVLTKDFKEFTRQSFSTLPSTRTYERYFYKVGNYIVSAYQEYNTSSTDVTLEIYTNGFEKINMKSFSDTGTNTYDRLFLFATYSFGMYFCARGTLYYINGESGSVTVVAKFDTGERIYSMFVDEKYVYYLQYSTWKWYRALLGDTEFTEIGDSSKNFSTQDVITIGDKWIARTSSEVMYSKKDISNWITTKKVSSSFMDSKGGY